MTTPTDYPDRVRALLEAAKPSKYLNANGSIIAPNWECSACGGFSPPSARKSEHLPGCEAVKEWHARIAARSALDGESNTLARAYLDLHAEVERLRASRDLAAGGAP